MTGMRIFALCLGLAVLADAAGRTSLAAQQELLLTQLTWFDRDGRQLSKVGGLADHGNIELSPDGTRIAVAVLDRARGSRDIWVYEANGTRTQVTSSVADENWSIWSPDGQRIVFNAFSDDRALLLQRPSRGTAPASELFSDGGGKWPVSWSPDGSQVIIVSNGQRTGNDLWLLPLAGAPRLREFSASSASENWAAFSPDGRFAVYSSNEPTNRPDVYVAPIPGDGRMWRISPAGGSQARWRQQNEIVYLAPDKQLMSVQLRFAGNELVVTGVDPLFSIDYPYGSYHAFDISPDGQRILVNSMVVSPEAPTLTVLNAAVSTRQR